MSRTTQIGYNRNFTAPKPIPLDTHGTFLIDTTETPLILPIRWGIKEIRIKNVGPTLTSSTGTTKLIIYLGEVGQPDIDLMEATLSDLNLGTNVSLIGTDASPITDVLWYQKDLMIKTDVGQLNQENIVRVQFKMCGPSGAPGGTVPTHILADLSAPGAQCDPLQNGQTHTITGVEPTDVTTVDWYAISDPVSNNIQSSGSVVHDPATDDVYELIKNDHAMSTLIIRSSNFPPSDYTIDGNPDKNRYLVKRNSAGMVQWVVRIHDSSSSPDYQWNRVAFDALNNEIQFAGSYTGALTFYNANGAISASLPAPTGTQGIFTARYSAAGDRSWVAWIETNSLVTPSTPAKSMDLLVNDQTGEVILGTYWELALGDVINVYNAIGILVATYTETSTLSVSTPTIIIKYIVGGIIPWTIMNETSGAGAAENYCDGALHSESGDFYWHIRLNGMCDYAIRNSDTSLATTILGASNSHHLLIKYDSLGFYQWHTFATYTSTGVIAPGTGRIVCDQKTGLIYGIYDTPMLGPMTLIFQQSDTTLVKPIDLKPGGGVLVQWGYNGQLLARAKYQLNYVGPAFTIPLSIDVNPTTGAIYFTLSSNVSNTTSTLELYDTSDTLIRTEKLPIGITNNLVKYSNGVPKWTMHTKGQYLGFASDGTVSAKCGNKINYVAEYQTGTKTYNNIDQLVMHSTIPTGGGQVILQVQDNDEYSAIVQGVITTFPAIVYTTTVPTVLCFEDAAVPFVRAIMEPNGYFELAWNGSSFDLQNDHWVTFQK